MANVIEEGFDEVVAGLKWVGKEVALVPDEISKLVTTTAEVEKDAAILLPELVTVIADAGGVVTAAVAGSGVALAALEDLITAIVTAAKADALNFAADEAVVAAIKVLGADVTNTANLTGVIQAAKKLAADWDNFTGTAKAALAAIEADI